MSLLPKERERELGHENSFLRDYDFTTVKPFAILSDCTFFFFLTVPIAHKTSWARDRTTAVTMPDP